MMFCWYKNTSNGCTKGPDSLLLNTFPSQMKGGSDLEEAGKPCHAANVLNDCNIGNSDNHATMIFDKFGNNATMAFSGEFLPTLHLRAEDTDTKEDWQLQVWGTPWTPDEFVDMSVKAGHPAKLHLPATDPHGLHWQIIDAVLLTTHGS